MNDKELKFEEVKVPGLGKYTTLLSVRYTKTKWSCEKRVSTGDVRVVSEK